MTLAPLSKEDEKTVNEIFDVLVDVFKRDAKRFKETLQKVPPAPPSLMTIPRGMSIDLDAGQVLALAREAVNQSGGSYPLIVREILAALELLREAFKPEGGARI